MVLKSKMNNECKRYVDSANKAYKKDLKRRRNNVLKRMNNKTRKKDHTNRIKRFIIKAQTDAEILNKSHNSFVGVYILLDIVCRVF